MCTRVVIVDVDVADAGALKVDLLDAKVGNKKIGIAKDLVVE